MALVQSGLSKEGKNRLEDYLNDQFQNVGDLENIDSLLAKVREQQQLLKDQLVEARKKQENAELEFTESVNALERQARKHESEQIDLDHRLQTLTHSEVSEDAIIKFDQVMTKLRRVDIADGYVRTLQEADNMNRQARANLDSNPDAAIQAYSSLQRLVQGLERAQILAEGAAPHLLDQISTMTNSLYEDIKREWEEKLRKALDGMKWPKKDMNLTGKHIEDWSHYTKLLLKLQEPSLLHKGSESTTQAANEPTVLLPLAVMVQPLALRFRFHFYGDKPTNRLDKPEYFLSHTLDLLEQHNAFLTDFVQPNLDERIQQDDQLDMIYTDAISAFISALLPIVSAKCLSLLPQLTSQPQLMSHLVHELMSFDETLQQSWAYSPYAGPLNQWKGLTWDMLTKHGYFEAWITLEKNFALTRYRKIRDDPDSNKIDFDGVEATRTKPTKGAIRVNDLLETITDRYRRLASFSQKMKFLIEVQISIFDDYHGHLHGVFQAYRTSSHTAGRMISGVSADDAMGPRGLEALLKIFGSAEYLERKMGDWSDDVFFLELWEELQDRAAQNTGGATTNRQVGRNLTIEDVASKTSATLNTNTDNNNILDGSEAATGALFDETASSYRRLRELSEGEIIRLFEVNVRNAIKPFLEVSIWASLSSTTATSDISQLAPTSALDGFDQATTPLFSLLAKVLSPGPLRRIVKRTCLTLQAEIYDKLLMRYQFSAAGANQLRRDVVALTGVVDRGIGMKGEANRYFSRLNDAISMLGLPIKASGSVKGASTSAATATTNQDNVDDDWGFEDEEDEVDAGADAEATNIPDDDSWGLWQAEKAIFADNISARNALESMGLTELSEIDARNIIRRRIEIGS